MSNLQNKQNCIQFIKYKNLFELKMGYEKEKANSRNQNDRIEKFLSPKCQIYLTKLLAFLAMSSILEEFLKSNIFELGVNYI